LFADDLANSDELKREITTKFSGSGKFYKQGPHIVVLPQASINISGTKTKQ